MSRHVMPFGATLLEEGGVRFQLWAPSVSTMQLKLFGAEGERLVSMQCRDEGWFECHVANAQAGSRYQYLLPDGLAVPDPASRSNPEDIHAPSEVIDPASFVWTDKSWQGRPWHEAVIYELHVGTFNAPGTFLSVIERLDYLCDLGITAIEIMPVADFPGQRNWGYDGVLLFAPDSCYGRPDDFKALINAAHERGLMVFLDVVYNHFGPEGNYLHAYAESFFNPAHHTPWGAAINFDGDRNAVVRDFFIHNALYWLEEFHLDGLRLDAVHAMCDESPEHIVTSIARAISEGPGGERHIHLILENDQNQAHFLERESNQKPKCATAQWNDDLHHVMHVLLSGETDGYYVDYSSEPIAKLGRSLSQGFVYQGDASPFRAGELRGETSAHLPPMAFIDSLQTHDQVGNRAYGERISHLSDATSLQAAYAILLLAPATPMLFMGEEFAAEQPFLFFCDFGPELAQAVTEGRRREFASFARFTDPAIRDTIPDPNALATFTRCQLDWASLDTPAQRALLDHCRALLAVRRTWLMPRLENLKSGNGTPHFEPATETLFQLYWTFEDGSRLLLLANFGPGIGTLLAPLASKSATATLLHHTPNLTEAQLTSGRLPPWSVAWYHLS